MDTVLIGGLSVIIFAGVMFLAQDRWNKADISPTVKRVGNYVLVAGIIIAALIAIDWHSSTWLATRS